MEDSEGKVFRPQGTAKIKATGENQHGVWSIENWGWEENDHWGYEEQVSEEGEGHIIMTL